MRKWKKPNVVDLDRYGCYTLPFLENSRVLSSQTLNDHAPKKAFFKDWYNLTTEFDGHFLQNTLRFYRSALIIVYMKITESSLLIYCAQHQEGLLSKYAYAILDSMLSDNSQVDFEQYYWPGVYGEDCSKYWMIAEEYNETKLVPKTCYQGLYKPGTDLPEISGVREFVNRNLDITINQARQQDDDKQVLGFCIARARVYGWSYNNYLYLVPFIGKTTKDKDHIYVYEKFINDWSELAEFNCSLHEEKLVDSCFAIKDHTVIPGPDSRDIDPDTSKTAFELWHQAMPLFLGVKFKEHTYAYGMRGMKGKPRKTSMMPYVVSSAIPKLVFSWKDKGEHFQLRLRVKIENKLHRLSTDVPSDYFVSLKEVPNEFLLLSSLDECRLIQFFSKSEYQMTILKIHYNGSIVAFVERLKELYEFKSTIN
jgi:hypothetical protein